MTDTGPDLPSDRGAASPEDEPARAAAVGPGWAPRDPDPAPAVDADAWRATAFASAARRIPIFSLEGRAAPGLYAAGWLLTVVGLGLVFVALASTAGGVVTFVLAIAGLAGLTLGIVAAAGAQGLQRKADAVPGYAGPSPYLVVTATIVASLLLTAAVSPTGLLDPTTSLGLVLGLAIIAIADIGLVGLLVVGTGALTWAEMGLRRPTRSGLVGDVGWGFALGIAALFATALVASILVSLLGVEPVSPVPPPTSTVDRVLNLVAAVVIAPVIEEILYRGFATTAWARRMSPGRAILRGALLFALVHVLTVGGADASEAARVALIAFVARIPVAWLLGWVFVRRGSLWAAIALHATFNGVALVLADLAGRTVTGG